MNSNQNVVPKFMSVGEGIFAIDTDYVRPLMDASHLVVDNGRAAFVDTGTTLSVPNLLSAMDDLNIDYGSVEQVFLTHIHLDHAGGAGELLRHLPNARAYIHPYGAKHMCSPEKIIQGTIAVYGEQAYRKLYGDIIPIDPERVVIVEDGLRVSVGSREFELFHTPGHALHHYCLGDKDNRVVFSGDTFGVSYRETDTGNGNFIFPTTTPTHFDPDAAHTSIDRIMSYAPESVYVTHYSRVSDTPRLAEILHRDIDVFANIAKEHANKPDRVTAIREHMIDYIFKKLDEHGFDGDYDAKYAILKGDMLLNAQGLDAWIQRLEKHG